MTEKAKQELHREDLMDQPSADCRAEQEEGLQAEDMERLLTAINEKNRLHDELNDRLKRLQADFDNFRRRTRQEKEELSGIVTEGILLQMLPVIDNFERALAAPLGDAATVKSGVEMIFRQMTTAFEQMGLASITAIGESFDPQYHEAVMRMEDPDQPDGIIVEELQKGYTVRSKVIRPSMVKVISNN